MTESKTEKTTPITFAKFLESVPPNTRMSISDLVDSNYYKTGHLIIRPELQLHCTNSSCNRLSFFRAHTKEDFMVPTNSDGTVFIHYSCSNCRKYIKTFALAARSNGTHGDTSGTCFKFGEHPEYGDPTPARLIRLIGPDRDAFLKGRKCENQGLGIAAFAYYRRVVENQKNRIFDEIIAVSKKLILPQSVIDKLEDAKQETQFSKSVDTIDVPQALLIDGCHNPLKLLHSALSKGLHAGSDAECLEIAHSIRFVLADLSERLGQASKDEAELKKAVSKLLSD